MAQRVIVQFNTGPAIELRHGDGQHREHAFERAKDLGAVKGFQPDMSFEPVALAHDERMSLALAPSATWLTRGEVDDDPSALEELRATEDVAGVFADPIIEPFGPCLDDEAIGTEFDVARLLRIDELHTGGMDGSGVHLAVIDFGINLDHLRSHGRDPRLDLAASWSESGLPAPGQHPVGHGTMVAYDAGIAAPASVLVDMPLFPLAGRGLRSLLSTAIAVYGRLHDLLDNSTVGSGGLVVLNAWGLNTPAEDHPRGSEGNYSDNPIHPFTRVVQGLASAGADVVFAAGNCGPTCPSHLCDWGGTPPIVGANSAREVLTVGAVDVTGDLAGYSAYGPGRLWAAKPDVVAYSQFTGSCARAGPDFGTSAASGVAAGVLAAVRTRHGPQSASSGRLVDLTCRSAGPTHDAGYGWGVLSPPALLAAFAG